MNMDYNYKHELQLLNMDYETWIKIMNMDYNYKHELQLLNMDYN